MTDRNFETIQRLNTAMRAIIDVDDALSYVEGYGLVDVDAAQGLAHDLVEEINRLTLQAQHA